MARPKKYSLVSDRMVPMYGGPNSKGLGSGAVLKFPQHDPTENIAESFGPCKNAIATPRQGSKYAGKCKNFHVVLGNGYCMACWDVLADGSKYDDKEKTKDRFQGTKIN